MVKHKPLKKQGVAPSVSPVFLLAILMWRNFDSLTHFSCFCCLDHNLIHQCTASGIPGVMLHFTGAERIDSHNGLKAFSSETQHWW